MGNHAAVAVVGKLRNPTAALGYLAGESASDEDICLP